MVVVIRYRRLAFFGRCLYVFGGLLDFLSTVNSVHNYKNSPSKKAKISNLSHKTNFPPISSKQTKFSLFKRFSSSKIFKRKISHPKSKAIKILLRQLKSPKKNTFNFLQCHKSRLTNHAIGANDKKK